MALVPVVDLSDPGATARVDLERACRDHGFLLVRRHGLDAVVARTRDEPGPAAGTAL